MSVSAHEQELSILDFGNCYVFPGLIDLHVHGALGFDLTLKIVDFLSREGVTRFLATTLTESRERIVAAIEAIIRAAKHSSSVLGIHLEDSYLSYGSGERITLFSCDGLTSEKLRNS